jgi:LacI family transcriptional regulator, galactose operon repressor
VLSAASTLNFRPNGVARGLRTQRTHTLGLVTDDLEGVFTTSMLLGLEETASVSGFNVFLCNSRGDYAREQSHLEALLDKQVEGVVLCGHRAQKRGAPALHMESVPVVYLHQYTHEAAIASVVPDDLGGAELGTAHLLEAGCRQIGFINGPPDYEVTHLRSEGYQRALEGAGIAFDPSLVRAGRWAPNATSTAGANESSGYRLARELMALRQPPDGIFCAADSLAAGALDALHELRIKVPQEVQVVGFDNRSFAAHQRPPLTTVALPLYEMGKLAGELLLASIQGNSIAPSIHRVACHLVERQSSRSGVSGRQASKPDVRVLADGEEYGETQRLKPFLPAQHSHAGPPCGLQKREYDGLRV